MLDSGTIQQGALSDKINGIQFSASYNVYLVHKVSTHTQRNTYLERIQDNSDLGRTSLFLQEHTWLEHKLQSTKEQ